ncbi:hypothetical protein V8E54_001252 [Elaphomyces granulatus]
MPQIRNILHRKDKIGDSPDNPSQFSSDSAPFKVIRSDTYTEEDLHVPTYAGEEDGYQNDHFNNEAHQSTSSVRRLSLFHRRPHSASVSSGTSREKGEGRLSHLLHPDRSRSRSNSSSSVNIPDDLPPVPNNAVDAQEREAQWEKRATTLVQMNPQFGSSSRPSSPSTGNLAPAEGQRSRSHSCSQVNDREEDINIQEAIRLHESGNFERSTQMFGQLADPNGANNALGQVLYGLALRHGWGCKPDLPKALTYLSAAASNSASVEAEALQAGMKKGGAAKGELVLAIFELGNCFRYGWGVKKDPAAARQYYETAANLGDTDAMNETAWCYLEGFGGKKDKVSSTNPPCFHSCFYTLVPYLV